MEKGNLVSLKNEDHIWSSIFCVEAAWIIAINIITILTFSTNNRVFSRAVNMLINLSIADMLYGFSILVLCMYMLLVPTATPDDTLKFLRVRNILIAILLSCAFFCGTSLFVVAVDRVFATFFPFRYRVVKKQYYFTVAGINFSLCLGLIIGHLVTPSKYAYIYENLYGLIIGFSLIGILTSYIAIYIKVRSQGQLSNMDAQAAQLRERNMAYTAMIVTLCSLLTWLPLGLIVVVHYRTNVHVTVEISFCTIVVQVSNSFLNPVIYAFRMRHFRKALLKLLYSCVRYRINPMN